MVILDVPRDIQSQSGISWKELPIMIEADVVVVGGGPAGVTAAVASARIGCQTVLIERYGFLGGTCTAGALGNFCGYYTVSEGKIYQVVTGLAQEIRKRLKLLNAISDVVNWGEVVTLPYDIFSLKCVLDELVSESKVHLFLHSLTIDVVREKSGIRGVVVSNKSGIQAILGNVIVDATGDADVAALCGVPYQKGRMQYPSLIFRLTGVDYKTAERINAGQLQHCLKTAQKEKRIELPRTEGAFFFNPQQNETICNMTRISKKARGVVDGTDVSDLTYAELEGRKQVSLYYTLLKEYIPGFRNAKILDTATQVGIRETRKITGKYVLTEDDIVGGSHFPQVIARGAWPVEIHGTGSKIQWKHVKNGVFYEIPYGCLLPQEVDNLLVAGRCISATHEAQASARVSAICMATGQAAGTAAALSSISQTLPGDLAIGGIQESLRSQGVEI